MDIKIKNESVIGLMFKTDPSTGAPGGSLFSGLLNSVPATNKADGEDDTRPFVKMQPGMNLDLMPGESAEVLESKSPHGSYLDYIRFRLRFVGLTLGFPLEFLLLDSSETNYSGLMMLAQMVRKAIKTHQMQLSRLASRIYLEWLGRYTKSTSSLPDRHTHHEWGKPGVGFVDIGKEVKAFTELINTKLASRQQILSIMGDGQDFEDLMDEVIDEQDYMHEKGIVYEIGKPGAVVVNAEHAGADDLEVGNAD
jgi:capsid protein